MRFLAASFLSFAVVALPGLHALAQNESPRVAAIPNTGQPSASEGSASAKQSIPFTYILFWKQNDQATQQFAETIRKGVARRPAEVNWKSINVSDQANKAIVAQYGVSRAPMPLAICVADNGAITSVFTRRPNDTALDRAICTPAMVTVTKGLQDKKIVVVHVKATKDAPLPYGAFEFTSDPDFKDRAMVVDVVATDAKEGRFLTDMEFKAASIRDSSVVVMAPPAMLVGKFASTATKDEIITKLHAAGKCCDDPNCKHNKKSPSPAGGGPR
jgi:hypothetical protein